MKHTVGLIIILLGASAAVPVRAQVPKRGTTGDVSEGVSSEMLISSAANSSVASGSVAQLTLTNLVLLPNREVMDCVSGQRCIFFPDRRGQQAAASQDVAGVDLDLGVLDQEPRTAPTGATAAPPDVTSPDPSKSSSKGKTLANGQQGFAWGPALAQSLLFLGIEHGVRVAFDPPTRHAMSGPFWNDYVASLKSLKTWGDNNVAFINYLGHPMQGAITGYIQVQNDPKGRVEQFGASSGYWHSRLKALGWSAAYSTFFELGFPVSEAAVGNLGINRPPEAPKMGYVDLVITPTLGTVWLIAEDAIDRYVVRFIEGKTQNQTWRALARSLLNPMRSVANVMRFRHPWTRDDPGR